MVAQHPLVAALAREVQLGAAVLDLRAHPDGGLRVPITLPRTDGRATAEAPDTETSVAR
ncbi:hypothetical protein ACH4UV_37020 [Streptomyces sp. NPDC020802]|uniref:hypothetical protein n=1 Tax=Streptomyces sp. NPDC020802 TaxID=3365094 RepID=UPI00379C8EEE